MVSNFKASKYINQMALFMQLQQKVHYICYMLGILKNITVKFQLLIVALVLLNIAPQAALSQSSEYIHEKCVFIYNFPKYIEWEGEDDMYELSIGVYGVSDEFLQDLLNTIRPGYADGTEIIVEQFFEFSEIHETQILVIDESKNGEVLKLNEKRAGWNTLFITENVKSKKVTMVNFFTGDKGQVRFSANKAALDAANLRLAANLSGKGGDEIMMAELFQESEKDLENQKVKFAAQNELYEKQKKEIAQQMSIAEEQTKRINEQNGELLLQQKKMAGQQTELAFQQIKIISQQESMIIMEEQMEERAKTLRKMTHEIEDQQEFIKQQEKAVTEKMRILKTLEDESKIQQSKISLQKKVLDKQSNQIQTQQGMLFLVLAVLLVMVAGAVLIYRGYRIKKETNKKLEIKNIAILRQKEELSSQAILLENTNKELEKLSIVASETDNAIRIMDANGNYEWVNDGFTRMYGYNVDELIAVSKSIISPDLEENTKTAIMNAISAKKTYIYESINSSKNGGKLWSQTTLTPIINNKGIITKLVAIDSNISKMKEAEAEIAKQRDEIEIQRDIANKQKEKIKASIVYAKRIQTAVIPPEEDLNKYLDENFVLFKPRDIVSGDYYWMTEKENQIVVVAADCTGHGVPGAFMSMLGIAFLNEIVNKKSGNEHVHSLQANEILNELRQHIMTSLNQTGKRGEATDGMDAALIILDKESRTLQYSGAHNPLVIFRNGEMITYKGDKMAVGWHRREGIPFTNHVIDLLEGDMLYMFSDGYVDQFGGPKKKKLTMRNFAPLLEEIHLKPADEQKAILDERYETWRGELEQIDDVLVMGMRMSFKDIKQSTKKTLSIQQEITLGSKIEYDWRKKKILIAEDTELNYILLVQALGKTGATLLRAKNGLEAIEQVQANSDINIVLMDLHMPQMDGFTATKKILKVAPKLPILAQTAMKMDGERELSLEAGCIGFINKPINLKTLLSVISKYII